jgi:FAD/FMN-containing dehydrogenases
MAKPARFPELTDLRQTVWTPKHLTFEQGLQGVFRLDNPVAGGNEARYKATARNLQRLLGEAVAKGVHIKLSGGTWSMSRCAATDGWEVNTKSLNLLFHLRERSVRPEYSGDREALWLAQCGCSIAGLTHQLKPFGQSLPTCGASNGQTIAGAIATGTHGSAVRFGAIQEAVRGLHIVVSPTKAIWLVPATDTATVDGFAAQLDAELVRDDALFDAALVSFGAMGLVQGVLIQARRGFTLRSFRRRLPYDDAFKQAVSAMDFAALPVPAPARALPVGDLWHYAVVIDPFHPERGVFITAMYDQPCGPGSTRPNPGGIAPGDELYGKLGGLLDLLPGLIPGTVSLLLENDQKDHTDLCGTLDEHFAATETRGKAAGTAVSVATGDAIRTLDLLIEINRAHGPFPCVLALRFVPGTRATLGFTRFPRTCVIDVDGPYSTRTRSYYARLWQALHDSGIDYGLHWGKVIGLSASETRRLYGDRVDRWEAARDRLLPDAAVREALRNSFLDELGLG